MPRCWVTRQERPLHAPNMVFLLPGSQGASGLLEPTASPADNEGMDEGAKRGKQRVPILASAFLDSITAQPCTQSKGLSQLGVPGFSFVKKPRCQQVLMGESPYCPLHPMCGLSDAYADVPHAFICSAQISRDQYSKTVFVGLSQTNWVAKLDLS